jgi:hypothetical protein
MLQIRASDTAVLPESEPKTMMEEHLDLLGSFETIYTMG